MLLFYIKRFGTSLYASWRKIFLFLYSINWPNLVVWLPLLCDILSDMCIVIIWQSGCDAINFEINLIFLTKPFFLHDQNVKTKIYIYWEQNELLRWNKKHFSSFIKSFHWNLQNNFLEGESSTLSNSFKVMFENINVIRIFWEPLDFYSILRNQCKSARSTLC